LLITEFAYWRAAVKKLAIAVSILAISAVSASAADMAVKAAPMPMAAPFSWTGFYVGGNVGYGWGDRGASVVAPDAASVAFFGPAIAAGALPTFYKPNPGGVIGGVQAGYNWQFNRAVVGIEADFQGSDVNGTRTINTAGIPGFVPITGIASERLDWFGTVRGRLGYAANTALFYVTGGVAYGSVNHAYFTSAPTVGQIAAGSARQDNVGYAVGAGVEWAFNQNWSVKGEYLFMDLGSHNTTAFGVAGTPVGATLVMRNSDQFNIARVGVNYRWGGPVVAKY
jgi:outer membrane immunogenic protein